MQILVTRTLLVLGEAWEEFLGDRVPEDVHPLPDCPEVLAVTFGEPDEQHETGEAAQQGQRPAPETEGQLGEDPADVCGERDDEEPAE